MKKKGLLFTLFAALLVLLTGCDSLDVMNPKGPMAKTQSDVIIFSMIVMAGILFVVYALYIFMLTKYRASKAAPDYEPPHEEGSKWLEITWSLIPVIIVTVLSVVTIRSTVAVESPPEGYDNQKPLVIYAASSNFKWHFSYPEEGIETVNYLNIPTNRPIEFRLYSYGPITSFWVPQLGGQKYAMSDMVTTLHLAADHEGSFDGKNSNFSGKGFAHMQFEVLAMSPAKYTEWVKEVKGSASELTEEEFNSLLKTEFVGRKTYSSTHLTFRPAPEGEHGGHHHGGSSNGDSHKESDKEMDHSKMDHSNMDHSNMNHSNNEHQEMEHAQHGN